MTKEAEVKQTKRQTTSKTSGDLMHAASVLDGATAGQMLENAKDQRAFVLAFVKAVDPITLAHFVAECDNPSPATTAKMHFGQALTALKQDKWARRSGWNGKGMHLYLEASLSYTVTGGVFKGTRREYAPCICLFNSQGVHQPGWTASQADMLADDWEIAVPS